MKGSCSAPSAGSRHCVAAAEAILIRSFGEMRSGMPDGSDTLTAALRGRKLWGNAAPSRDAFPLVTMICLAQIT